MSYQGYFKGKNIFITGAGRGIGNALAKKLHELGATIYALSRTPETLQKLKTDCPSVHTICADLGDWEKTREVLTGLDVVFDGIVNNAGILIMEPLLKTSLDTWDKTFNVNVKSAVNVVQCLVPKIIEAKKPCSIVNISSTAAHTTFPGFASYSVSKAAMNHLTKCMAVEFGPHKIRVNCVNPAGVQTDMLDSIFKRLTETVPKETLKQTQEYHASRYPLGESVIPMDDIVNSTLFLLSNSASTMTGQCMYVDGGLLLT